MNRILLIVEGEKREKIFFDRYKTVKKMDNNLDVVPFRQNIKELFRLCNSYIFDGIKPNNIIDILRNSNITQKDAELLEGQFTDIYLIFDLDIQNAQTRANVIDYLNEVSEVVKFFDDSTTIGQILINYPMMDSIFHIKDDEFKEYKDIVVPSDIEYSKEYKRILGKKKLVFDSRRLIKNDFDMLSAINMKKANYIVREDYDQPDSYTFLYELSQENILAKQIENIEKHSYMYVLNSSLFIDVDLFGNSLYFHERGKRLFCDDTLIESIKHK